MQSGPGPGTGLIYSPRVSIHAPAALQAASYALDCHSTQGGQGRALETHTVHRSSGLEAGNMKSDSTLPLQRGAAALWLWQVMGTCGSFKENHLLFRCRKLSPKESRAGLSHPLQALSWLDLELG